MEESLQGSLVPKPMLVISHCGGTDSSVSVTKLSAGLHFRKLTVGSHSINNPLAHNWANNLDFSWWLII